MLFLREYPNECVSGPSGISSIQLKKLCRNFGIPFNERDTKKIMCQKIKRYLLDRTLPNSTTSLNTQSDDSSYVPKIPEEDTSDYTSITSDTDSITQESDTDSITQESDTSNLSSCINNDYIMNEPYTKEDNPIQIYTLNSQGKFKKSSCITKDELSMHLSTGKGTKIPEVLQAIYTTPSCGNSMCTGIHESLDGKGTNATGKLIVKIPPNNIWVTLGSIERVMKSGINEWYALPLYGGKRRRIGNLDEMFAASRNHGQVPGFHIYKLFTKQEIKDNVKVKETSTDYPIFLFNNTKKLYDIIGGEVTIPFVDNIIDHLLS